MHYYCCVIKIKHLLLRINLLVLIHYCGKSDSEFFFEVVNSHLQTLGIFELGFSNGVLLLLLVGNISFELFHSILVKLIQGLVYFTSSMSFFSSCRKRLSIEHGMDFRLEFFLCLFCSDLSQLFLALVVESILGKDAFPVLHHVHNLRR